MKYNFKINNNKVQVEGETQFDTIITLYQIYVNDL